MLLTTSGSSPLAARVSCKELPHARMSRPLLCLNDSSNAMHKRHYFPDSTAARTVLAAILEILSTSGHDLSSEYSDRKQCPMPRCFHTSATPMEQITHVKSCGEASRGEIRCWTCEKCHEFKRWHTVLKSPVELLRRLSNRKRGNNTSTGEPFANKKGRVAASDEFETSPRQEILWPEMEDPINFFLPKVAEVASTSRPAQLEDTAIDKIHMPLEMEDSSAVGLLPTPPSSRDHSRSDMSQNSVAYGDMRAARGPEQPPPYIVSPQTTVDGYQQLDVHTNNLRLDTTPFPYLQESLLMESPEDLDIPDLDRAPWADQPLSHEGEDTRVNLRLVPSVLDATITARYGGSSERPASISASSFTSFRERNPQKQKQNTWPKHLHRPGDARRFYPTSQTTPTHDSNQRQIMDGVSGLTEQGGQAATAGQQDSEAKHSIVRQPSFDVRSQDSITVNTAGRGPQPSRTPEGEHPVPAQLSSGEPNVVQQHDECELCGRRFGGIPKNRKQHLKRHKESKHSSKKVRFRCGHAGCRSSYNRVDNLHDHEKKCHGFVLQQPENRTAAGTLGVAEAQTVGSGRGPEIDEPADSVDLHGGGPYRVGMDTHHQTRGELEAHFGAFGYSIPTEERGWGPARDPEEWDVLMAGVSGGSEIEEGSPDGRHEAGTPEDGFRMDLRLAPRPLDIPYAPWRVIGG